MLRGRVGGRGNLDSLCTDSWRAAPSNGPLRCAAVQVTCGNTSSEIDRNNVLWNSACLFRGAERNAILKYNFECVCARARKFSTQS